MRNPNEGSKTRSATVGRASDHVAAPLSASPFSLSLCPPPSHGQTLRMFKYLEDSGSAASASAVSLSDTQPLPRAVNPWILDLLCCPRRPAADRRVASAASPSRALPVPASDIIWGSRLYPPRRARLHNNSLPRSPSHSGTIRGFTPPTKTRMPRGHAARVRGPQGKGPRVGRRENSAGHAWPAGEALQATHPFLRSHAFLEFHFRGVLADGPRFLVF